MLALLAGMAAFAIAKGVEPAAGPADPRAGLDDPLPDAIALLNAVDTPLMIVRHRRVLLANAAARNLLGHHIEGGDVRLAIRHPAAAERLSAAPGQETEG